MDLVRQRNHTTTGLKRTGEQAEPGSSHNPQVLNAVIDIQPSPLDHKRQKLTRREKPHIVASEIRNVNQEESLASHVSEYSQRRAAVSTPSSSSNPLLSLSHSRYGLPETLVENLASLGINSMYPWQSSCLLGRGLLTGEKNLVYTAPTGGGKSLVADILMLKRVIEDPATKAIVVLPYVALVQEKLKWLRKAVEGVQRNFEAASQPSAQLPKRHKVHGHHSVRVAGFFGGSKARATWSDVDLAVCTIEKVRSATSTSSSALERSDTVRRQIHW